MYYSLKQAKKNREENEFTFRVEEFNSSYFINSELNSDLINLIKNNQGSVIYHEILNEERKMYFDIDCEDIVIHPGKMIRNIILYTAEIIKEFYNTEINIRNFMIFESNGETQNGYKFSYHIILDGFYFEHFEHCRFIAWKVKDRFPKYSKYIDDVYSKNKNIRVLYSSKLGSSRVKNHVRKYKIRNMIISQSNDIFNKSIISNILGCDLLVSDKLQIMDINSSENDECVDFEYNNIFDIALDKLLNYMSDISCLKMDTIMSYNNENIFIIINTKLRKSFQCFVCDRIHDSHAPYFVILKVDDIYSIYFKCRRMKSRDKNHNIFLGIYVDIEERNILSPTEISERYKYIKKLEYMCETKQIKSMKQMYELCVKPNMTKYLMMSIFYKYSEDLDKIKELKKLMITKEITNSELNEFLKYHRDIDVEDLLEMDINEFVL